MIGLFGLAALVLVLPVSTVGQNTHSNEITFSKDVAPILYENCVYCHRPGEIGPMSLLTYKEARPWARSIRQEVVQRRMPPWRADPHFGDFRNNKRLSDADIRTIVAWVDGGAKEGNPADMPPAPQFAEGWQIGIPDLVVAMAEPFQVPAKGVIPWMNLPSEEYVFPEDTWVQAIEVRPGNRAVVHHASAGLVLPEGSPREEDDGLHLYAPGLEAIVWRDGYGKLIRKGSRVRFNMHYNAIGREATDQTKVGFKFASKPVHTRVHTTILSNDAMLVPPMTQSHQVMSAFQFPANARIHAVRPHMHVRGKTATASLVYPDGLRRTLLYIPEWDDAWQTYYVLSEPARVPRGAVIEYLSTYDNSPANPLNPDPKVPVAWGQQVWEEMHSFFMTWTEINERNSNDGEPIQVPANKAFTTGVISRAGSQP
jgi:hypothetical protein